MSHYLSGTIASTYIRESSKLPISPVPLVAENIDDYGVDSLTKNVTKDANRYFANQEYFCFGSNSNTYFQYAMLYVGA